MRKTVTVSLLIIVLLGASAALLLSAAIYSYHRLTAETLIAELRFDPTGDREYLAHLRTGDRCEERTYPLFGDQWRVDAEFVKWKYWALLIGLDSHYRLDRLEGRYRVTTEQNERPNIAHDLGGETALDLAELAAGLRDWNFLLDASYGSSTYQDIDAGRLHYVYRTQTGIITRSSPRPVQQPGEPLPIDIDNACAAEPSAWRRAATWVDGHAKRLLDLL